VQRQNYGDPNEIYNEHLTNVEELSDAVLIHSDSENVTTDVDEK